MLPVVGRHIAVAVQAVDTAQAAVEGIVETEMSDKLVVVAVELAAVLRMEVAVTAVALDMHSQYPLDMPYV